MKKKQNKFIFDKQLQLDLLHYVESIAVVYYNRHKYIFERDSIALDDLKQEAKIVCLKMIDSYGKKEGKNNFNIKKFISRAVGWKLRDMMNGAIVQNKNTLFIRDLVQENNVDKLEEEYFLEEKTNNYNEENFLHTLSPKLVYGFTIKDVYKKFSGKELLIIKGIISGIPIKVLQKELGYKNNNSIRDTWNKQILPKVIKILKPYLKEYDRTT